VDKSPPLRRARSRSSIYSAAIPILVDILTRDAIGSSEQAIARADEIIRNIDAVWRFADRSAAAELRQRRSAEWPEFRLAITEHGRRARIVAQNFAERQRRDGATTAAKKAAQAWTRRLSLEERRHPDPLRPIGWETRISEILLDALEAGLQRPLRFSRPAHDMIGGPDVRLLAELFQVVRRFSVYPTGPCLAGSMFDGRARNDGLGT
jgi:hypothetical protein